jgi:hypothetical protein
MEVWGQTNVVVLYDRAKADEDAAAALRRFRELENQEEAAFSSLLWRRGRRERDRRRHPVLIRAL